MCISPVRLGNVGIKDGLSQVRICRTPKSYYVFDSNIFPRSEEDHQSLVLVFPTTASGQRVKEGVRGRPALGSRDAGFIKPETCPSFFRSDKESISPSFESATLT